MGKYDPLKEYLEGSQGPELVLTFTEIESILNRELPRSARDKNYQPWWANGPLSHQQAWMDAGWRVASVVPFKEKVTFIKQMPGPKHTFDFFGLVWPNDTDKIEPAYQAMLQKYNPAEFASYGTEFVELAQKKTTQIESMHNAALALVKALSPKNPPPKAVLIKHR